MSDYTLVMDGGDYEEAPASKASAEDEKSVQRLLQVVHSLTPHVQSGRYPCMPMFFPVPFVFTSDLRHLDFIILVARRSIGLCRQLLQQRPRVPQTVEEARA